MTLWTSPGALEYIFWNTNLSIKGLLVRAYERGFHTGHAEIVAFAPCIWCGEEATMFTVVVSDP